MAKPDPDAPGKPGDWEVLIPVSIILRWWKRRKKKCSGFVAPLPLNGDDVVLRAISRFGKDEKSTNKSI